MSLDKVNEGFEGDQKTLVKEKDASLEEGQGGDGHQVNVQYDNDEADDYDDIYIMVECISVCLSQKWLFSRDHQYDCWWWRYI